MRQFYCVYPLRYTILCHMVYIANVCISSGEKLIKLHWNFIFFNEIFLSYPCLFEKTCTNNSVNAIGENNEEKLH